MKDGLYGSSGNIYPGTSLTLTCNPPVNNSIQWTLDGKLIKDNSNNILQLDNVSPDDSGKSQIILLDQHITVVMINTFMNSVH